MWVSHVRGEGEDGDGEVSKMLTRRLQTIEAGHTIGDVDMILRRPHLASVIVSSAQCELVEISTSALRELVDKNKMLVKQITRQALLEEGALFSSLPFPGSRQRSEHAGFLTDAQAAGEVAALCTSAVFS
jgi:CRP-like cAMP-binding protein